MRDEHSLEEVELGLPSGVRACLFDLDGVLTSTAELHAAAWTEMFDAFLRRRSRQTGEPFVPFDPARDYHEYVDGRPRADGVRSFLAARGITIPDGDVADPAGEDTVHGLGNRKNELVLALIASRGVQPYEGSVRYLRCVRKAGLARAVVSASKNCRDVLAAAGIDDLFDVVVDGAVAEQERLRGKPAPDTFLAAASQARCAAGSGGRVRGCAGGCQRWAGRRVRLCSRCRSGRTEGGAAGPRRRCRRLRSRGPPRALVITHPAFSVDPWSVRETGLDLEVLAQTESIFALSNGHIGLRANLDEGEPFGLPGTYLNSFYEMRQLPHAEPGYGYPEAGQTIVNATNGKIIRLLVDDEPFDVRYGELIAHERELDLRAGVLRRRAEWRSPAGAPVRVCSTRLVSFVQRAVAAILYEIEPLDEPLRVVVQSELVANEAGHARPADPRAAAALEAPLQSEGVLRPCPTGRARSFDAGEQPRHGGRHGPRRPRPRWHRHRRGERAGRGPSHRRG